VLKKKDPNAVACVVTADHVIQPVAEFQQALRTAFSVAEERPKSLVTFGIVPTHGHTGLGYIHRGSVLPMQSGTAGAYAVQAFKEKPDKVTADQYVDSGRYYWNSGMFVWRADTVLDELGMFLPENKKLLDQIADAWGTDRQQAVVNQLYPQLKKISIDYAVMEPASLGKGKAHVVVVEMPVQWTDVGSWPALAETLEADAHNNAVDAGATVLVDSDDNIVISSDPAHLVSLIGVSDMIIVHTKDATLVCHKHEAQRVKDLVGKIKEKFGDTYN